MSDAVERWHLGTDFDKLTGAPFAYAYRINGETLDMSEVEDILNGEWEALQASRRDNAFIGLLLDKTEKLQRENERLKEAAQEVIDYYAEPHDEPWLGRLIAALKGAEDE